MLLIYLFLNFCGTLIPVIMACDYIKINMWNVKYMKIYWFDFCAFSQETVLCFVISNFCNKLILLCMVWELYKVNIQNNYFKKLHSSSLCVYSFKGSTHNYFFYFLLYIPKKRVLNSRKFSTTGFWWIYMFSDVLNTIWPFLEKVSLPVCMYVSKIFWTLFLKN